MAITDLSRLKAAARREAKLQREEAFARTKGDSGAATRHLLSALAQFRGRVIAGYLAMGSEIDPGPAMERLHQHGPVVVPEVREKGAPLVFRRWQPGCTLVPNTFGTMIPEHGEEMEPEALIVPLLAFDQLGHRLGYGGGFYDRTLARLRGSGRALIAVGFAWSAQEMAALPVGEFDARLDAVVTEKGIIARH